MTWFERVVSALAYSLAQEARGAGEPRLAAPYNDVAGFLQLVLSRMPDYLRLPVRLATLAFDLAGLLHGGALFHRQRHPGRLRQIAAWRAGPFSFGRDFIRLYQSLSVFALYGRVDSPDSDAGGAS